ncbi:glycosyltransferase [Candidatus Woesebacteria bacterium]|nr:glycosyltransferase [Candidatus Woesebacteria bacterium]
MKAVDIIIPVKNEASNINALVSRIDVSLKSSGTPYKVIFIDDHSTDSTVQKIRALQGKFPVAVYKKIGKQGKAYSILEGVKHATSTYVTMIDADLQYPPEAIPAMLEHTEHAGVVVARRITKNQSILRKFISKSFQFFFGKLLFGFDCDVQSGLKVFKKEILHHVNEADVSPWTIDVPLLFTALELGYTIDEVEIEFENRYAGVSKIKLFSSIREIGGHAFRFRLQQKSPLLIHPKNLDQMVGAGIFHKGTKFITHTTLEQKDSALKTFIPMQIIVALVILSLVLFGLFFRTYEVALVLVAILTIIYFVDVLFNLFLILRSLHFPPEIQIQKDQIDALDDSVLPTYSVLCPLYKEAHVLPSFLTAISKLDWPKEKLDVLLLLEEDDVETISAAQQMDLPSYVRIQVVPDSQPKTKPKACNYGLNFAKGEYLVIYDAEDMPDPLQLKKVYIAYQQSDPRVKCIQAKLNYYNPNQNLLTRFFTAEYSLWFDVILTGLQSIKTVIPLGGTSNHFRTQDLIQLQGWDPFNVTEDCDLGIRLFKAGAQTAIIDSVTLEEANSNWHNWLRQRSRWIKGYMQSYLVHIRSPRAFFQEQGIHAIFFHLTVGGKILFLLINPILWLLTLSYFTLYAVVGPTIESLYPAVIFYMAVSSLVFGNFMFMYYYMIGIAKREHWATMKFVFLVPIYWLLASVAALIALYQLIVKPHYWEKTIHGLHLKKDQIDKKIVSETGAAIPKSVVEVLQDRSKTEYVVQKQNKLLSLFITKKAYIGGLILILASVGSSFINFIFNIYMGRVLTLTDLGNLGLLNSLYYLAMIPFGALTATITYQAGFLDKKNGRRSALDFWNEVKQKSKKYVVFSSILWLFAIPFSMSYFNTTDATLFLVFAAVLIIGIPLSIDRGLQSGLLFFTTFGLLLIAEALAKILLAFGFVLYDQEKFIYFIIPLSLTIPFIAGRALLLLTNRREKYQTEIKKSHFPRRFFVMSMLTGLSQMSFLSLDILFAKHYFSAEIAGEYNLIALVGKMIFFGGTIVAQFIIPFVSRDEASNKSSSKTLNYTLAATFVLSTIGVVALGVFGSITAPALFGSRIASLTQHLAVFTFGMMCFVLARVFVTYYLAKKTYLFAIVSLLLTSVQVIALLLFHSSLEEFITVMTAVGILNFIVMVFLHKNQYLSVVLENNVDALISWISKNGIGNQKPVAKDKLKILFFNWRDTKHTWSGGAEVYVHEIAKNLVADDHKVTVFCGNDGNHPRNEVLDGVQIVRRGGFYTVYIWAFLYYMKKFRGLFDVVVDCENGIPFFTPLFVEKPKVLLIHHIHQEIFRAHLRFPMSVIAEFIESKLMPIVYKNQTILTVSESTQNEIVRIGLGSKENISIIYCGIADPDLEILKKNKETEYPSFLYLGRLKQYKNVDVAIKAFKKVVIKYPKSKLTIAGDGEKKDDLELLIKKLDLQNSVEMLGKVTEQEKFELYAKSWVCVHPSEMEGWGITVIEANSYGTPVIASDTSGLRESVVDGKSGILVPTKNISALAEKMEFLIKNHSIRKEYAQNAREWSENFRWSRSAESFVQSIKTQAFSPVITEKIKK